MAQSSGLLATPGVTDLYSTRKGPLRMSALQLTDGSICIVSPVAGLSAGLLENARDPTKVKFLLAPNHYHNQGLQEFSRAFPAATVCAPESARPRLEKQTGLRIDGIAKLAGLLPAHMQLIEPPGLKTGEIWLAIKQSSTRAWFVVDAFRGPDDADDPPAQEPALVGTFPSFGVGDAGAYTEWVLARIAADAPNLLIPCHGALVQGESLPKKLAALVRSIAKK
ncbi:MAG: hypothetical protein RIF32_13230 [Leptospirales bacterium]